MYKFLIPETLCGLFIGKSGRNISALKHETNTNIKIGREPVLSTFRYCTVEGRCIFYMNVSAVEWYILFVYFMYNYFHTIAGSAPCLQNVAKWKPASISVIFWGGGVILV